MSMHKSQTLADNTIGNVMAAHPMLWGRGIFAALDML